MKPSYFKEVNCELAKDQPEYLNLPVHIDDDGIVTSCWILTFKERIKLLFYGEVYLQVMTFKNKLQPQKISIENPFK